MNKVSIPIEQVLLLVKELLNFPGPRICTNHVSASLLCLLETNGFSLTHELAEAVVGSDNDKAIEMIDNILGVTVP